MIVEKSKENLKKCKCISCPSYTTVCKLKEMPHNMYTVMTGNLEHAKHFEGMFCAFGKSECIKEDKGCVCTSCDVAKEHSLKGGLFCENGSADQLTLEDL